MEKKITYNNGLGTVKVLEDSGKFLIKATAHNRVWKKVSDTLGGLARIEFDTDQEVIRISDSDYAIKKMEDNK